MEQKEFLKKYNLTTYECMSDVLSNEKAALLVKGTAGSGKTLRFLARIAYQLQSGVATSENMLNLVYDAETARRMNRRYEAMFSKTDKPVFVDMFSFCYRIVSFYDENNGHAQRKVYRDLEKAARRILKDTFKVHKNHEDIVHLLQKVNECKVLMLSEKEIAEIQVEGVDFFAFYNAYEKFKKNKKLYDKADVLHEALHILMYDKEIVDLYRKRFAFINIDDAQELSYAAHMIVRMLHAQKASLCAFVDESQYIDFDYVAQPSLFSAWKDYYGKVIEVKLPKNYRMNKTIATLVNNFYYKEQQVISKANDEECDIKYKGFSQWFKMYDYALRLVNESPEETAFIYRETPYAIPLIDSFHTQQKAMRYHCNVKKFLGHSLVKDICSFISLFSDPRNMKSFFEIHDRMGLDMSNKVLLEIDERIQHDENVDVYQAVMESGYKAAGRKKLASYMEDIRMVSQQTTFDMVQYVFEKLDYVSYMKEQEIEVDDANVITLLVMADRYRNPQAFLESLKELANVESDEDANIIVSDIESVRGQEFSRVCILDCFASVYPKASRSEEEAAYERRLFYTAMTRAKHNLEFFTSKRCFDTRLEMSPFIFELHGKKAKKQPVVKSQESVYHLRVEDLKRGKKITHTSLGVGEIIRIQDGMMEVQFENEKKMLNVKMCVQNKLVELV